MNGRTETAAIAALQRHLQRALATLTRGNQLIAISGARSIYTLRPPIGGRFALRHPSIRHLWHHLEFTVVDTGRRGDLRWEVQHTKYIYRLDLADEQELLAFHWHPEVPGRPDPHLHLGPASQAVSLLRESHVPTGMLSLADVLRYAIGELGVEPLRPDWRRYSGAEIPMGGMPLVS